MSDLYSAPSTRVNFTTAYAGHVNDLSAAVAAAFNKFPPLSGNGSKGLVINAGGTAVDAVSIVPASGGRFTGPINYSGADNASDTNSGYGSNALTANAGGTENSAFGYRALRLVTSGYSNTAVGAYAGTNITTGHKNTAVGDNAAGGGTGNDNTALGYSALLAVANGSSNTAVGSNAASAYSGDGIVAVGFQAAKLTTGGFNTALGYNALAANITGQANCAIGYGALALSTANQNTAVGGGAGQTITSGVQNTLVGVGADTIAAGNNCTALGYGAVATQSNQVVIGNSAVTEIKIPANSAYFRFAGGAATASPLSRNANYTVDTNGGASVDSSIICSAALVLTLPSAALFPGRWLYIKNTAAGAVTSAISNVVPLAGGAAGAAILSATAGKWVALQSDGANWQVMMAN